MGTDVVAQLATGAHPFAKKLEQAKRLAQNVRVKCGAPDDWRVLNVLHRVAGQVAALDLGYMANAAAVRDMKPEVDYLLGADSGAISREDLQEGAFVVYQGHHGDKGAEIADLILPGAAYTEKQGTYVNTEGRAQQTLPALNPPGMARVDWKIIRAISEVLGETLPYDTIQQIRGRLSQVAPSLTRYGLIEEANYFAQAAQLAAADKKKVEAASPLDVTTKLLEDFYMTDSISRASPTMAKCVTAVKAERNKKYFKS